MNGAIKSVNSTNTQVWLGEMGRNNLHIISCIPLPAKTGNSDWKGHRKATDVATELFMFICAS